MDSRTKANFRAYGLYFLFWTALGLFLFSQSYTQTVLAKVQIPWWRLLGTWVGGVYLVGLAAPLVLWLGRRYPLEKRYWARRLALHLPVSIVWAVGELAISSAVLTHLNVLPVQVPGTFVGAFIYMMVSSFHNNVFLYWEILAVQAAFGYYRRYREREKEALRLELHASELKTQLVRAQLNALKMQLQPHFLFNTLNAIMVLVRQQRGREAEETLARFSDLLRCVLEDVEAQEVTLRRELDCLQLYLSIEQVRFQDRLHIGMSISPEVLEAAVPQMALQPIVENAIRHGIGRRSAAGRIRISAERANEMLRIKVEDDGPGFAPGDSSPGRGIGLANTRARLQQLHGDKARLETGNGPHGGAVVTLVLPFHLPADVIAADERVQFLTGEMVSALSAQDFEGARTYSLEDRKAREEAQNLRERYNLGPGTGSS